MTPFQRDDLVAGVLSALEDLKALEVTRYDLAGRSVLADAVILATGEAGRHIQAMADSLRARSKHLARHAIEGQGESGWVLVDLGDVVVHLMTADRRAFYDLDTIYQSLTRERA